MKIEEHDHPFKQRNRDIRKKLDNLGAARFELGNLLTTQNVHLRIIIEEMKNLNVDTYLRKDYEKEGEDYRLTICGTEEDTGFRWYYLYDLGKDYTGVNVFELDMDQRANIYHNLNSFIELTIEMLEKEMNDAMKVIENNKK